MIQIKDYTINSRLSVNNPQSLFSYHEESFQASLLLRTRASSSISYIIFLLLFYILFIVCLAVQSYNYFRNKRGFNKRILFLLFQPLYFNFVTMRVRYQNSHTYGSKPWEFWVESMALLGAKPHGFGWEMRAEGWMISPTRLRHFPESTRWRRGVDSYTLNQSSRRRIRVESAERSSRVEISRITTRGEIKKAPIHQNRRLNNHEKIVEEKNFNLPNRRRNCCHHHPHQSFRCHRYR